MIGQVHELLGIPHLLTILKYHIIPAHQLCPMKHYVEHMYIFLFLNNNFLKFSLVKYMHCTLLPRLRPVQSSTHLNSSGV
jgi:hypothetical protein